MLLQEREESERRLLEKLVQVELKEQVPYFVLLSFGSHFYCPPPQEQKRIAELKKKVAFFFVCLFCVCV